MESCCKSQALLWHQLLQYQFLGHQQTKIQQSGGRKLQRMTKLRETAIPDMTSQARYPSATAPLREPYCSNCTQSREPRQLAVFEE